MQAVAEFDGIDMSIIEEQLSQRNCIRSIYTLNIFHIIEKGNPLQGLDKGVHWKNLRHHFLPK